MKHLHTFESFINKEDVSQLNERSTMTDWKEYSDYVEITLSDGTTLEINSSNLLKNSTIGSSIGGSRAYQMLLMALGSYNYYKPAKKLIAEIIAQMEDAREKGRLLAIKK